MKKFLGVDIGGSSIKVGLVSFEREPSVESFQTIEMDHKSSPTAYADEMRGLENGIAESVPIGIGFPSVVKDNRVAGAPDNMHPDWRFGSLTETLFPGRNQVFAINDADAAGLAEVLRADAHDLRKGTTVVLTLGTGIGSAIFVNGHLLANSELGLLEMNGDHAERVVAPSIITRDQLSTKEWALRLNEYILKVEHYLDADTFVLGGGISTDFENFAPELMARAEVLPAFYKNQAGVIGAAAYSRSKC